MRLAGYELTSFRFPAEATAAKTASRLALRVNIAEHGRWALGGLWGGYVLLVCVERMRGMPLRDWPGFATFDSGIGD